MKRKSISLKIKYRGNRRVCLHNCLFYKGIGFLKDGPFFITSLLLSGV